MASSPCLSLLHTWGFGSRPICPLPSDLWLSIPLVVKEPDPQAPENEPPEGLACAACLWSRAPGLCLHTAPDFRRCGYLLFADEETKVLGGYRLWPLASGWKLVTSGRDSRQAGTGHVYTRLWKELELS